MRALGLEKRFELLLLLFVVLNVALWFPYQTTQSRWINVPPAPHILSATAPTLGDAAFAYRLHGLMIQNMGDMGGRVTALKDYNFVNLGQWFNLLHRLDPQSNYAPYLAAFYFGGSQDPSLVQPLVDYLRLAGQSAEGEKWRWLAQAVFLARFKMEDLEQAVVLARELANHPNPDMPAWARKMEAFTLTAKGEKEAAYELLINLLKTSADKMHPSEVNSTRIYICERILDEAAAKSHPLCQDLPI